MSLIDQFIAWVVGRSEPTPVVTFEDKQLFTRYECLLPDEWPDSWWDQCREDEPTRPNALPWWMPFNVFLHQWNPEADTEEFHDHPRWTITILLKGRMVEKTPWGQRTLKPGSIVIRSRKAIHAFEMPDGFHGRTWTLFIVGRRKYRQNTYQVVAR